VDPWAAAARDQAAPDALAALRDVIGVYSSDPTASLAWPRTHDFTADAFRRLEAERVAVRKWDRYTMGSPLTAGRGSCTLPCIDERLGMVAALLVG